MRGVRPFAAAAWALSLLLGGCGEPVQEAGSAPPPARPPEENLAKAAESADKKEEYSYNPNGKRDPFKGFMTRPTNRDEEVAPDTVPLQRWDIDKFALKGVIWDTAEPRGLLIDPEGTGHVIRIGTYVGRNWGKVTSINDEGVVITEEYQTLDGELVVNPVVVKFAVSGK